VFRKDRAMMERYPSLFVRRRKKGWNGQPSAESDPEQSPEPPTSDAAEFEPTADNLDQPDEEAEAFAQGG
jgi:hypothetical protein